MSLRSEVLNCYRALMKTRSIVFKEDQEALVVIAQQIRHHFRQNQNENDPEKIKELLQVGWDANRYLKECVVQAKLNEEKGTYELQIRPEVLREQITYEEMKSSDMKPCRSK